MSTIPNNPISELAIKNEFGFAGGKEGVIHFVSGSDKAHAAASQILSSLSSVSSIAKESGLGTLVGGAISLAALGSIDSTAIFMGAAAGAISSITKGR